MQKDSAFRTIQVAVLLCMVCSVLVTASAVVFRDKQEKNKQLDIKKNLLLASGLIKSAKASEEEINQAYASVKAQVIDLESGKEVEQLDPQSFDQRKMAKDPKKNYKIPKEFDLAGIKVRSKYALAYKIIKNGQTAMLILPVSGKGLWSTLYGFIALSSDTKTIRGIGFYEHAETPGLGGEVDNPLWKKQWVGKLALNDSFEPIFEVMKGQVSSTTPSPQSKVDGLSGATITSNGVTGLVRYWLGKNAFGPYLDRVRSGQS